MIDVNLSTVNTLAIHRVGNKNNGDDLVISKNEIKVNDAQFENKLHHYFLSSLPLQDLQRFSGPQGDFTLNPIYTCAKELFSGMANVLTTSVKIAKALYDSANHPNIKSGDLFVVHLKNISYHGENCQGLGIFKSEIKHPFLQINYAEQSELFLLEGIDINKLDKGALIINTEAGDGYRICIVDKTNKSEAEFWKDQFLQLVPCNDEFQQTKQMLQIASTFVTTQYQEEFEVEAPEQIELMQRSIEYFKQRESFDNKEFEREVLETPAVIESFRSFKNQFVQENDLELEDQFDISEHAVKNQQKFFKSIIKLDKNFHIYVHGNREWIERGVDADGRKYYKLYYKEETN